MINIGLNGGGSSGGLIKSVHLPPYVKLGDNKAIGMSQDDSSNNAQGTLYPTNLNTSLTSQTQITSLFNSEAQQYYPLDDDQYDVNESKIKVAEQFFTKFKKLVALLYSTFTSGPKNLPSTTAYIQNLFRVEWMSSSKVAFLYMDTSSGYVLKVIAASIGSDGLLSWGAAQTIKTYTDATHANYACANMALTNTDKLLVTYSNKVSTSYFLKARVVTASGTTLTPQSEGADNTNFGTSGPYTVPMVKIRGSAGAGAVMIIAPATSGTSSLTKMQVISHDNANAISYGAATVAAPSGGTITYSSMFSYGTDKLLAAAKTSSTDHIYARIYTVSGTTVTAAGAGDTTLTDSTSSTHYLSSKPQHGFINFGSNNIGLMAAISSSGKWRVITLNVASDTLTLVDKGKNTASQLQNIQSSNDVFAVTNGDSTGTVYGQSSFGDNPMATWAISYSNGRGVAQTAVQMNHDLGSAFPSGVWPSAYKTIMFDNSVNYNAVMNYQIACGDSTIQVLDQSNSVLATITEGSDGPGEVKLKSLQLTFNTARMIFKLKNTSAEARLIKISSVYASAE